MHTVCRSWHVCYAVPITQSRQDAHLQVSPVQYCWYGRERSRAGDTVHWRHGGRNWRSWAFCYLGTSHLIYSFGTRFGVYTGYPISTGYMLSFPIVNPDICCVLCSLNTLLRMPSYSFVLDGPSGVPLERCWFALPELCFTCYLRPKHGRSPTGRRKYCTDS